MFILNSGLSKKAIIIEKSVFSENTQIMRRILRIHRSPMFGTGTYQCLALNGQSRAPYNRT